MSIGLVYRRFRSAFVLVFCLSGKSQMVHSTLYCAGLANASMNRFRLAYLHCPQNTPTCCYEYNASVGVRACIK